MKFAALVKTKDTSSMIFLWPSSNSIKREEGVVFLTTSVFNDARVPQQPFWKSLHREWIASGT